MQKPTHRYVGSCRGCGAVLASCYDMHAEKADRKHTAQAVADMIVSNLTVERVPFGQTTTFGECTCRGAEPIENTQQLTMEGL